MEETALRSAWWVLGSRLVGSPQRPGEAQGSDVPGLQMQVNGKSVGRTSSTAENASPPSRRERQSKRGGEGSTDGLISLFFLCVCGENT